MTLKIKKFQKKFSLYIKPKMHGQDEVAFTNKIFSNVENVLNLEKFFIKGGYYG